jgi:D-alanine-D-alanine ligase
VHYPELEIDMNIEIVTTPNRTLKETGFGSIIACASVLNAVNKLGHSVELNVCTSEQDLINIVSKKPDLVILAVKYLPVKDGDDIWLSEFFENRGINFTGSLRHTIKFDSDKVSAKLHLTQCGIKNAKFFTATPGQFTSKHDLPIPFPLFLKPQDAANGNGVDDASLVKTFEEFERKLCSLSELYHQPVLVEEYLDGDEFTCSIINTKSHGLIVSVIEVIPPESKDGLRILGAKTKQEDSETFKRTANNPLIRKIRRLAVDSFMHLGIRDFARIDIKTNKLGECFFMEANLVPGMTPDSSYFPKAFLMAQKFSYDKVVQLIIEGGINRVPSTLAYAKDYKMDIIPDKSMFQVFKQQCNRTFNRRNSL